MSGYFPPARGAVPRVARRRAGRLGVPAPPALHARGLSAGGAGEACGGSRVVGPHGASRAAHTTGVPRYAAWWGLS